MHSNTQVYSKCIPPLIHIKQQTIMLECNMTNSAFFDLTYTVTESKAVPIDLD